MKNKSAPGTFNIISFIHRYHSNQQIKSQLAEMEQKHVTIASFDANDNEVSMMFPSLKVTSEVSAPEFLIYTDK